MDIVEVVDGQGVSHLLTKLERHILYCLDENRPISVRYYARAIGSAFVALHDQGLVDPDSKGLTGVGLDVVERLRLRHEKSDDYITP